MAAGPGLNFLLTESETDWYARCLEYDFVTQAPTLVSLLYEIQRTVVGRLMIGAQQGMDPFFGLHRADDRYWEMFRRSSTTVKTEKIVLDVPHHGGSQVPVPELRELRIVE